MVLPAVGSFAIPSGGGSDCSTPLGAGVWEGVLGAEAAAAARKPRERRREEKPKREVMVGCSVEEGTGVVEPWEGVAGFGEKKDELREPWEE